MPKPKNHHGDFEVQIIKPYILVSGLNRKTRATSFEATPEETIAIGFKVKPEKTVTVILRSNH
jgi:hypothetical protein